MAARRLPPEELTSRCDPGLFPFRSTADLPPLEGIIGQDRALASIDFGLGMASAGFNIYVLGDEGTGKTSAVRAFVRAQAEREPVPPDWCYVHNFKDPAEPIALSFPPGMGASFQKEMAALIAFLRVEIPKVFESREYKKERDGIVEEFQKGQKELFGRLEKEAEGRGFNIRAAMGEFTLVAVGPSGQPISEEEFNALDEREKERIRVNGKHIRERLDDVVRTVKRLDRETKERVAELERTVAMSVLGHRIEEIKGRFGGNEKTAAFLEAVKQDVLDNLGDFKAGAEEPEAPPLPFLKFARQEPEFSRYRVNVIVDNGGQRGSPCVFESNPTYYNLFGRMQHRFQMGVALTDFTMIKAGALHKANGGYLVINALDLLRNLFSYDALKRAIRNGEVRIEDVWEQYRLVSTAMLKPDPIPLDVKVILIGHPEIYYLLYNLDEEYRELFKVKADFDNRMARTEDNVRSYAAFVATKTRSEGLIPFDPSGVARLVDFGARLAEDRERLSSKFSDVANLIRESHYWAKREEASLVTAAHVDKAWSEKVYRHSMIEDRIKEVVAEGTLIVETAGGKPGQVNGLAVIDLGDYAFGKPSRITASVFAGKGGVVNIDRESKLSGKIHDKAVLILAHWIGRTYGAARPVNLSASITFEQLYGIVEGDSATCAELYALLSALAGVPASQSVAVTGSMDQSGTVQPVGGINEKVEGFFDLCRLRGLDGTQGVIIPARNVRNLVLKREVVEAVRAGLFHVYGIERVEEGYELLMGLPAGERGADGLFPEGTLNRLVEDRLASLREAVREDGAGGEEEEEAAPGEDEEEDEEEDGEEDGGTG